MQSKHLSEMRNRRATYMCVGVQGHNDGKEEEDVGERLCSSEKNKKTFSVFLMNVIGHGDAILFLFCKNRFEYGLPLYLLCYVTQEQRQIRLQKST